MVKIKTKFKTVGVFSNSDNPNSAIVADQIREILSNIGCRVLIDNRFNKRSILNKLKTYSPRYIKNNANLVIAIGGDGTMLSCSRKYGSNDIPILGINLGQLGFLTDIAPDELTTKLLEVISGELRV